jgi:hypothetical protein
LTRQKKTDNIAISFSQVFANMTAKFGSSFFCIKMSNLASEIINQKQSSFNNLKQKRETWDTLEELFHGQLNDDVSGKTRSQVFDPRLASLLIERSYRVMAQMGVGKVVGMGKNDIGDARMKNLLLDKYVVPNANSQFDLLTKFRMVDLYSNLYGAFFALVDWNVAQNGYVGPDMWLLNIRDVFPQVGAVSIEDSDSIVIRTWRPISFFKSLAKDDTYKNISKIVTELEKKAGGKSSRDSENIGKREEEEYPSMSGDGYYEVLTRYERDRWVDVCVDADMEFRDIDNPHDDGELPVVAKYSIPLIDDIMGLGDAERAMSMQKVQNAIWNLYLDAVKMSIYPPVLINKTNISSMSSLKWSAAAKWLVRDNINNAVAPLNLTPQGIATFNNTFQASNASLLNIFGTSDTTVTENTDAGYGKTPQALRMQQARENTRDNADRYYMELFVKQTMKKMVNLMCKKQSSKISIRMFPDEVQEIAREYPEISQYYNEDSGKLSMPKARKSVMYDYEIVSGSTYALDQDAQQENLARLLELYRSSQTPQGNQLVADLDKEGYKLNFGELFKRIVSSSGVQDWDKILTEKSEQEKGDEILNQDQMMFEQVLQQMQSGQNINQVPPTPQPGMQPGMPPEAGMQGQVPDITNQMPQ